MSKNKTPPREESFELFENPKPVIEFTVVGRSVPQGSKRVVGFKKSRISGRMVSVMAESSRSHKPWRELVSLQAVVAAFSPLGREAAKIFSHPQQALKLEATFYLARPASHWSSSGGLSATGRKYRHPTARPDVSKLLRSIEDSMTGRIYYDDSQIVTESISKRWCDHKQDERVEIRITLAD